MIHEVLIEAFFVFSINKVKEGLSKAMKTKKNMIFVECDYAALFSDSARRTASIVRVEQCGAAEGVAVLCIRACAHVVVRASGASCVSGLLQASPLLDPAHDLLRHTLRQQVPILPSCANPS